MKTIRTLLATTLALSFTVPVFARGGGFGGFHEGGGFGGDHSWGGHGFDHSFGSFGDFDHGFDRGAFTPGAGGYEHTGSFAGNHPNLGADGGFGGAAGEGHINNAHVNDFDSNRTNVQGSGNTFDRNTTVNNYNNYGHNNVANGYHADGYGYHADAYGYHPYGAYGYHGYGYGYHGYGAYGYHPYYGYHYGFYGYPGGWYAPGFMEASMWTFMGMSTMVDFLGIEALTSSNKKTTTNVTYQGDNVYINGVPQSQYYAQAQQLAATANATTAAANATTAAANATAAAASLGANSQLAQIIQQKLAGGAGANNGAANGVATGGVGLGGAAAGQGQVVAAAAGGAVNLSTLSSAAPVEKWQPLGVYSLVEPGQKSSTTLFQLAINKDGIIKGNYMNQITNEKSPLQGALDKKSGQISWYVGNNPTTVFETNFQEIAKKDSKVVVQFGAEQTQQMALIRLPKPNEKNGAGNNQNQEQNAATPPGS